MKKFLSIVLALGLILGMMPIFGDTPTNPYSIPGKNGGENLKHYGLIHGVNDKGDLALDKTITRAEIAKIICVIFGKKEEAEAYSGATGFADEEKIAPWARPWAGYAKAKGLFKGNDKGEFMPDDVITGEMMAAILLRALGYEEATWGQNIRTLSEKTGLNPIPATSLNRGQAFDAIWPAISMPVAKGGKTILKDVIGIAPEKPVEPEEKNIVVSSVEPKTLDTVIITFNTDVDPERAGKFVVMDGSNVMKSFVTVSGKTATVRLLETTFINSKDYNLSISGTTSKSGAILSDYSTKFTAFDKELPEVVNVEFSGPRNITITFSETISADGIIDVTINGRKVLRNRSTIKGEKVFVEFIEDFDEGKEYKLDISKYKDLAGYENVIKTVNLKFSKDTTAPTAYVIEATQEYVILGFSKPVKGIKKTNFAHSFNTWTPVSVNVAEGDVTNQVYIEFWNSMVPNTHPLQQGDVVFKILENNITDLWGNKLRPAEFSVQIVSDAVAPEILEAKATSHPTRHVPIIYVKFNKPVNIGSFNILDPSNTSITTTKEQLDTEGAVYAFEIPASMQGKTVQIELSDIVDTTVNALKMKDFKKSINVLDMTPPALEKITYECSSVTDNSEAKFIFWFDERLSGASANIENFIFQKKEGSGSYTKFRFADRAELGPMGKSVVLITNDKDVKEKVFELSGGVYKPRAEFELVDISGVTDETGNELSCVQTLTAISISDYTVDYKVEAVDTKTIKLIFSEEVVHFNMDCIDIFNVGGYTKADFRLGNTYGKEISVVLANPTDELATDLIVSPADIAIDSTRIRSVSDRLIDVFPTSYEEKIAPAVMKNADGTDMINTVYVTGVNDKIVVTFTEPIQFASGITANDFANYLSVRYAFYSGSTLIKRPDAISGSSKLGTDFWVTVAGNEFIIEVDNGGNHVLTDEFLEVILQQDIFKGRIADANGNICNSFLNKKYTLKEGE